MSPASASSPIETIKRPSYNCPRDYGTLPRLRSILRGIDSKGMTEQQHCRSSNEIFYSFFSRLFQLFAIPRIDPSYITFFTIDSTCAQRIVASIICKSLRFEPSIERDLQVSNFTGRPRVFQGASKNNDSRTGFTARTVGRYKFPAEVMRVEEV